MNEEKIRNAAHAAFTGYMTQRRLRKTPERYAILDKVMEMNSHFLIESLYSALDEAGYHVSRATVYNTIELLIDAGLVRRHTFGNSPAQYEKVAGIGNHHHLVCSRCGKVREVKDPELVKLLNSKRYPSFHAAYFDLYIYGVCSGCLRRVSRSKKQNNNKPNDKI